MQAKFELELQRQLAKAREDINMKIMEMEMAKMIERGHKPQEGTEQNDRYQHFYASELYAYLPSS